MGIQKSLRVTYMGWEMINITVNLFENRSIGKII